MCSPSPQLSHAAVNSPPRGPFFPNSEEDFFSLHTAGWSSTRWEGEKGEGCKAPNANAQREQRAYRPLTPQTGSVSVLLLLPGPGCGCATLFCSRPNSALSRAPRHHRCVGGNSAEHHHQPIIRNVDVATFAIISRGVPGGLSIVDPRLAACYIDDAQRLGPEP
ncbi:hypothetical protein BS50DRAFT_166341 [Corynespora cassiicola Philippines]|uniref:Uncharacterized protein n=1 Tax=Corynespora cassiicola Philippines TaxID=1448308 RepID=A0A2T2P5G6_CORCC|nr:hypothetical protein BS50DRAFT_166341 [Corynespora cassiicola Philippines]